MVFHGHKHIIDSLIPIKAGILLRGEVVLTAGLLTQGFSYTSILNVLNSQNSTAKFLSAQRMLTQIILHKMCILGALSW